MYYIGIDLGGTQVKIGLVKNETIVDRYSFMSKSASGLAPHLKELTDIINSLLIQHNVSASEFGGIGLSFPGIVDVKNHRILSTNNKYDDAPDIDIVQWAREHWNVSLFVDNDARMATVGEWQYGVGKGCDNLVMMTLGTGIGTSVIMEGHIVRGKHFQAGCLGGHFTINPEGPECNCGNIGCVEAQSSSWSLNRQITSSPYYKQSCLSKFENTGFKELFEAAQQGDDLAEKVKTKCLQIWSAGAVNLIHAYDPEMIVLGGGVMNSKDEILPFVRQWVNKHAWTPWGSVRIEASELMNDAAILGVYYCLNNHEYHN